MKDIEFTQLYVGFDGPVTPKVFLIHSREEIDKTWLKTALKQGELGALLKHIDFNHQILIAFAAGLSVTTNGTVKITRIQQFDEGEEPPVDVKVKIGVIADGCSHIEKISYPFVLAVLERPAGRASYGGYDASYFPDGCTPPKSGQPTGP